LIHVCDIRDLKKPYTRIFQHSDGAVWAEWGKQSEVEIQRSLLSICVKLSTCYEIPIEIVHAEMLTIKQYAEEFKGF
jgi:hypothetical protein